MSTETLFILTLFDYLYIPGHGYISLDIGMLWGANWEGSEKDKVYVKGR